MLSPVSASEFVVSSAVKYDQRSLRGWLISHLLRHKMLIVLLVTGAFGNAGMAIAIPSIIGVAFNVVLQPQPNLDTINILVLLVLVTQVTRAALMFTRNIAAEALGQYMERDVREELYANLLGKSMTFHSTQAVGEIMARATNDVHELNLMLNPGLNMVIGSAMFVIYPLVFAPLIKPELLLTPGLFAVGYALAVRSYASQLRPATQRVRARFGDMNAGLAEAIDGIETVKGASQESQEITRFDKNATAYRDAFVSQSDIEARFIPLLLLGIATGAAFLHALLLFRAGQINVGQVVTYMGYIQMFAFPVYISQFGFTNLSLGVAASNRVRSLILIQTELDENKHGH
ncbi:MAG: ABC transporter ATP-binding protein, partial [Chloroflexota bacterium]